MKHIAKKTIKSFVIVISYDLMKSGLPLVIPHSSYQAKGRGGSTMYFPLPFAKHCKITWQDFDTVQAQPRYYQINYRIYTAGTKVKTFNLHQLPKLKKLINKVNKALWNPVVNNSGINNETNQTVKPGEEISLRLSNGPKAITLLKIIAKSRNQANYPQMLRSTILEISFDGKQTVWCPIGDYAGSGVGGKPIKSWYRTVTNNGEIISRWIMPYKKSATISLLNLGKVPVEFSLMTQVSSWQWNSSSMYFHASWKMARNIQITKWDTTGAAEWNLITIKGKGVYLGNTLSVFNYMHTWYGEGDPKIWVDTASFPVEFGTGLEDYYNTSWAPVVIYQTPFANATRADNADSYGYNTFTRTCNLNRIPFNSYFRMDWEMLGWKTGKANIAATIYWYGFENASDNSKRMKKEATMLLPKEINR